MEWFVNAVTKKYATFTGRARRQEHWMFVLFYLIIAVVLSVIENIVGSNGMLGAILSLGLLVPSVVIGAWRLHTRRTTSRMTAPGRSGLTTMPRCRRSATSARSSWPATLRTAGFETSASRRLA
jgi:uncharacterized membrane protein YhaH (DUF805 family)